MNTPHSKKHHLGPCTKQLPVLSPNCTPSLIVSQSQNQRRRTATPVVSLNRSRPNLKHTWSPNSGIYFVHSPYDGGNDRA